jgi:hypothetical protein
LVVTIPCFNEPDLLASLEALWACARPDCAVEVIVVVNAPAGCSESIRRQNETSLAQGRAWASEHVDPRLRFHLLHCPDLPPKRAGVGLARKIAMDEAVRRLDDVGRTSDGIIACFDADCGCDPDYLRSLEAHFCKHPRCPACSVYFEHALAGPLKPRVYEAGAAYELHLRYYVQALRHAGFPFAFHTLGSCIAVRAEVYAEQGGMNKRQAGEDFYFLQKIIPLGGFRDLVETRVVPSPRPSDRVPFGTGKAVRAWLEHGRLDTYPLQAFLDLKLFLERVPLLRETENASECLDGLPEAVRSFLHRRDFDRALKEIRANTAAEGAFHRRFFRWFNGFEAMKFIHHARDRFYDAVRVKDEARRLLALRPDAHSGCSNSTVRELLEIFRRLDREVQFLPGPFANPG